MSSIKSIGGVEYYYRRMIEPNRLRPFQDSAEGYKRWLRWWEKMPTKVVDLWIRRQLKKHPEYLKATLDEKDPEFDYPLWERLMEEFFDLRKPVSYTPPDEQSSGTTH